MDHVVVLQVRADAWQFMQDRNTKVCKQCWWTNPRNLQQPRRIRSPGGEDHLAPRLQVTSRAAGSLRVPNPDRPFSLEHHRRGLGSGTNLQVAPLGNWSQKCPRRTHAPAVLDIALIVPDPRLTCAVVVGIARQSEVVRSRDERIAKRVLPIAVCDGKRSLQASVLGVACPDSSFGSFKVRKHVSVAPAAVAPSSPTVEILVVAPVVVHSVDRGRTTERLALRDRDGTVCR